MPANALIAASATAESRFALVASPGLAVGWPVRACEQARHCRPVVEVGHDRYSPRAATVSA